MDAKLFECLLRGRLEEHLDRVHALFDELKSCVSEEPEAKEMVIRARMAAHEWIANLIQHAHYAGRTPEAILCLAETRGHVYCLIEDNSAGFELMRHMRDLSYDDIQHLPERGMGLLMMRGGATSISYHKLSNRRNRLTLVFTREDAAAAMA